MPRQHCPALAAATTTATAQWHGPGQLRSAQPSPCQAVRASCDCQVGSGARGVSMSPAGHCRADCTFREVREKARQPGALLTRLPIAEQCGVATSWGSPKEGLPPYCFSHHTIPSASPGSVAPLPARPGRSRALRAGRLCLTARATALSARQSAARPQPRLGRRGRAGLQSEPATGTSLLTTGSRHGPGTARLRREEPPL